MSSLLIVAAAIVFVLLFAFGVILLGLGVEEQNGKATFFGFVFLVVEFLAAPTFFTAYGATQVAQNNWPTSLRPGMVYVKEHSKKVEDKDNRFNVWLEWNNGQGVTIYQLKEDPPKKFIVDRGGKFVAVE